MITKELKRSQCRSAAQLQKTIDSLKGKKVKFLLPEIELELDRSLILYSNMELAGQGEKTILRKGPGARYPLSGYHNYGMADIPLLTTKGLSKGMTVAIQDKHRGGFWGTFAKITWVKDKWIGLDRGIESDYANEYNPVMTLNYPLIFSENSENITIRDIHLDGNLKKNKDFMNGCRGGAIFFIRSKNMTVENVNEYNYNGEGLSFQMCYQVYIKNCQFNNNTGNGLHPGAGSTRVLFEKCTATNNHKNGFFFCVRANHITVKGCNFLNNHLSGVSIGTRDCHNIIENCYFKGNMTNAIDFRHAPLPIEVHNIIIQKNTFSKSPSVQAKNHIHIQSHAHQVIIEDNRYESLGKNKFDIVCDQDTRKIFIGKIEKENTCIKASAKSITKTKPAIKAGLKQAKRNDSLHLTPYL